MSALKDYATPVSIMVLSAVMLFDHFGSRATVVPNSPTVNGEALGKAYSKALAATYADAWIAAAKALEEGKTVSEAQKSLQDTWKDGRSRAFKAGVEPGFSRVLPAGAEPADPAHRTQVAQLWRAFAKGLTGVR